MYHHSIKPDNRNNNPRYTLRKNNNSNITTTTFCKTGSPIVIIAIVIVYLFNIGSVIEMRESAEQKCLPALTKSLIEAVDYLEPLQDMGENYMHRDIKACRILEELRSKDIELRKKFREANSKLEEEYAHRDFIDNRNVLNACEEGRILHEEELKDNIACLAKYSILFSDRLPLALNSTQLELVHNILDVYLIKKMDNKRYLDCAYTIQWHHEFHLKKKGGNVLFPSIVSLLRLNETRCKAASDFDSNAPKCEFKYNAWGLN